MHREQDRRTSYVGQRVRGVADSDARALVAHFLLLLRGRRGRPDRRDLVRDGCRDGAAVQARGRLCRGRRASSRRQSGVLGRIAHASTIWGREGETTERGGVSLHNGGGVRSSGHKAAKLVGDALFSACRRKTIANGRSAREGARRGDLLGRCWVRWTGGFSLGGAFPGLPSAIFWGKTRNESLCGFCTKRKIFEYLPIYKIIIFKITKMTSICFQLSEFTDMTS